jgi:hypothetical protein
MKVWGEPTFLAEYKGYAEYHMDGKDGLGVAVVLKDGKRSEFPITSGTNTLRAIQL